MSDLTIPRPIAQVLSLPAIDHLARLALASPFLISGAVKLLDFEGAANEVAGLGLQPEGLLAAAVILTQLGGSLLFLTRRYCWLGAGILVGFTGLATLLAHPFWTFEGLDRGRQTATFFEHLAIVGGFAMAVLFVNSRSARP
ncbi:DoxX family protein (plasmid) [Microvirga terrae]|uniref:DoxX family protein n=1 Tax=Microvirga terrae TaxID=2740529 RepID=A0ABY5S2L9_9HYPH|nr:DoxX family protein [Microvirga terrae]UVF22744.1 DoxX family protein [Microvirga terrae]